MIDGDINEFINDLHYGIDLYVRFNGNTYSFQGWDEGEMHTMLILKEKPLPVEDFYKFTAKGRNEGVNEFMKAKLWDGKTFMEVEKFMTQVDC